LVLSPTVLPCSSSLADTETSAWLTSAQALFPAQAVTRTGRFQVALLLGCTALGMGE
jgi:hypothetical protein